MDVSEIRRANLRALLARWKAEGKTAEELAAKVQTSAAYLSQMLGPNHIRDPGGRFCRKVEEAMLLDRGYLDRDQSTAGFDVLSAEARELLNLWSALPPPTQAHLKGVLKALAQPGSARYLAFEQSLATAPKPVPRKAKTRA